jgi:hypothetical protein
MSPAVATQAAPGEAMNRTARLILLTTIIGATLVSIVPTPANALQCGVWRWPVKTLSDRRATRVDFHAVKRKVLRLRRLDPPGSLSSDTPRLHGIERQTMEIRVVLREATIEDDHDVHLVVGAPGHRHKTMIVEFPYVRCNGARRSIKETEMRRARRRFFRMCGDVPSGSFVRLKGRGNVTGVGFWDEIHGQTGVAPNGIELHPVLDFISGSCRRARSSISSRVDG